MCLFGNHRMYIYESRVTVVYYKCDFCKKEVGRWDSKSYMEADRLTAKLYDSTNTRRVLIEKTNKSNFRINDITSYPLYLTMDSI